MKNLFKYIEGAAVKISNTVKYYWPILAYSGLSYVGFRYVPELRNDVTIVGVSALGVVIFVVCAVNKWLTGMRQEMDEHLEERKYGF